MAEHSTSELESCTADAELLGAYVLISELASGQLSAIHRAQAPGSTAPLVIRRLQYQFVHDIAARTVLLAAGHAAMSVRSPHVARVLAVHDAPEPFLVMEYVAGATLQTIFDETQEEEVLRYAVPVLLDALEALQVMHERVDASGAPAPLVHCAPLARHLVVGLDGSARLIDFTHAVGAGMPTSTELGTSVALGERMRSDACCQREPSARADLFTIGTLLFQALIGRALSPDEDPKQALRARAETELDAGALALLSVCARSLAGVDDEGYRCAADMLRELRNAATVAQQFASRDELASLVRTLVLSDERSLPAPRVATAAMGHARGNVSSEASAAVVPAATSEAVQYFEGLPSIVPSSAPRSRKAAGAWLLICAAALALLAALWADRSTVRRPRHSQAVGALRDASSPARVGALASDAQRDEAFDRPARSMASSALRPRSLAAEAAANKETPEAERCPAPIVTPPLPRARAARVNVPELPANPY